MKEQTKLQNPAKEPPIEVWDLHDPIIIGPDRSHSENYSVLVTPPSSPLPEEYERMVRDVWSEFCAAKPNAKENQVFYLTEYRREGGKVRAVVEQRGFSYNQAFNRGNGLPKGRMVSAQHNILPFTIMCYVLTKGEDGERDILFGRKNSSGKGKFDDKFSLTSIAGGFANTDDLAEDKKHVDVLATVNRQIATELGGEYLLAVERIEKIGLVYRDVLPNRGFDTSFLVYLDRDTREVVQSFEGRQQYQKGLTPCRLDPASIETFLVENAPAFSSQAMAVAYSAIAVKYGKEEAEKLLRRIEREWGRIHILEPFLDGRVKDILEKRRYLTE